MNEKPSGRFKQKEKSNIAKNSSDAFKQAAALSYNPDSDAAPKVVALGKGQVAEKILDAATEHDIPVYRDEKLIQALNCLKIGEDIPPELYDIVAEILVFVNGLDQRYGELINENK